MPNVTLPDGTVKSYDQSLTVAEVASSIGSGLAKAAIAGEVGTCIEPRSGSAHRRVGGSKMWEVCCSLPLKRTL